MSKFMDKLGRLHQSRVRALEADDNGDQKRVFVAEDARTVDVPKPAAAPEPEPPPPVEDSPARAAVREQLQIGARLGSRPSGARRKPDKPKLAMQRAEAPPVTAHTTPPRQRNENAVGERVGALRIQAEALIDAGGLEHALPLLHEMAALSPAHPFPLRHLADYWRGKGEHELAAYYVQRLAAAAPY